MNNIDIKYKNFKIEFIDHHIKKLLISIFKLFETVLYFFRLHFIPCFVISKNRKI